MNANAQMSSQISGQVSSQAGTQVSGPTNPQIGNSLASLMQSLGPRATEQDVIACRRKMQERIYKFFQRSVTSDDWLRKVPEYTRRMEERLFRDPSIREIYLSLVMEPPELRLYAILKKMISQIQNSLHNASTSTSHSTTMIPTPGMSQNNRSSSVLSNPVDNAITNTSHNNLMSQSTTNMGTIQPSMKPSVDISSASFSASANGFQQQAANLAFDSDRSSVMSSMTTNITTQLPQMIPTPGYSNQQTSSLNSDVSSGVNISNRDSNMAVVSQHQTKHLGSRDNHALHGLGGQNGLAGMPNVHQSSSYGISNRLSNGNLGLVGSNIQISGRAASEGFLGASSSAQQILPVVGDAYPIKSSHLTGSDTYHGPGSSVLPTANGLNGTNLQSNSRSNSTLLNHHASLHSLQNSQNIRTRGFDEQQLNFHPADSATSERLSPQQQHVQQMEQQPKQKFGNFVQNQQLPYQQPSSQNQQYIYKNGDMKQNSVTLDFDEQMVLGNASIAQTPSMSSQSRHILHADFQPQYARNAPAVVHGKNTQLLGHGPSSQDFEVTLSHGSGKVLPPHQQTSDFSGGATSLSSGTPKEIIFQPSWHVQPPQNGKMLENPSTEQLQAEFHQRIKRQEEAQQPQNSVEQRFSNSDCYAVPHLSRVISGPEESVKERNYLKQRRWLLFMIHAKGCSAPKGQCKEVNCTTVQELLIHMSSCKDESCKYARCSDSKKLVNHFKTCQDLNCPVCAIVHHMVARRKPRVRALPDAGSETETKVESGKSKIGIVSVEASNERQLVSKRMKIEEVLPTTTAENETTLACAYSDNEPTKLNKPKTWENNQDGTSFSAGLEANEVKFGQSKANLEEKMQYMSSNVDGDAGVVKLHSDSSNPNFVESRVKEEVLAVKKETENATSDHRTKAHELPAAEVTVSKPGKPNIKGVSLTELFTPEQIREHIIGLRQWVGQSKAKVEKNQAMEQLMSENSCQLCAVEKLTFDPPPLYCSLCGARIKRNAMYYTIGSGETRHYFCIPCYNEVRADSIQVDGSNFLKARMEKKKNDEDTEEWWVQCDKCEAWQHQICALFNRRRNDGGSAEYTCANCYVIEVERGERKPLPESAVLGAKDLPRTILSDHIEQRLFRRLKNERLERAKHLGKSYDEVPGAEGLVVRVVSSVDKKLEVKPRFLEIFEEENYPKEFSYKSKAVLLFQKIEGVEVCLFGMYVQEFGSECAFPNQRRVYLSYLDSVKYFRPEIKTVSGEALRTFVYHEILIGYLEYCKKRGFTSCYIWACPPLKGEDYILYCHPEIQKTPRSDKLREWYLSMLRKASKENIVVELTNLYDHFFITMGECKARVTAARLPYFDGDYWPGAAEDMINLLRDEEDGRNKLKKGTKKTITKRALKAAGQTDLSGNASKDALLMQKLGETIYPMKEDFIMVHLQHCCNHCCILMVSGTRWVCNQCKNFQLCEKCFDADKRLGERERHPIHSRDKHTFSPIEIDDVALDTKDKDDVLESEFFDTRQAFLSLCQGNNYQYDTLRRAKHSSMMVLYHLHNPTAPAFVTTCYVCQHDVETGQGWRCEVCPEFDVCSDCYSKGAVDHPHKLTNHPSMADSDAQNKEARQQRVLQLRKMLDLLVHASQCRFPQCQYPNCRKVKGLFRHGIQCKKRVSGGCHLCKKMWYLLQLHARACKEAECTVPRCRDLREHLRRMQQQSDSRRRAAVMEMMRQRAAEIAGKSG